MSLNDTRISLFNHFEDNWTTTSIVFEGQKTGDTYIKRSAPWLHTYIVWGGQFQKSTAAPTISVAKTGLLIINLYVRDRDGIAVIDEYTDGLFTVFRSKTIGDARINDLFVDKDDFDGVWRIRSHSISFTARTVETIST